ncbi:MAG: hypothetical protein J6W52_07180 [Bacteroidaceae bacterium]|nr:hypothetical protein [Bacteroidaceae bacterium]
MSKTTYLFLSLLLWTIGQNAWAQHEHDYVNGICTYDDCLPPAKYQEPTKADDGFYEIRNAGNVEWISYMVRESSTFGLDPNCRLMNDIDFEGVENLHSPIGPTNGKKYNGTFDGQGFRIKNMIINRPNSEMQGFFGSLRGNPNTRGEGTIVKNLIIDKSCSITGGMRTGGITGTGQNNEKEIIIMNCVNEADITSPSNNAGGITGGSSSNHPIWKISNCVNTGKITSTADNHEAAGISAWLGDNGNTRVTNCINIGVVEGMDGSGRGVFRQSNSDATAVNCYDLSGMEDANQFIDYDLMTDDVLNGKATYIINQRAGGIVFWQTIGEDEYPMPFSTSKQVYLQGELTCDGTPIEGGTYTNNPVEPVRPPHEYEEGDWYCINCGAISDSFCQQVGGFYQLNNELDVCWFAEFVKAGNVEVNAKLNSDLDFTDYPEFSGIADRDHGFKGIFEGGFHTISNMDMSWRENEDWVGFINFLNGGATVRNLRGDATCLISAHGNAGLIGGSTASGNIYLENLGFEGDVSCQRAGAGGILGCNTGSQAHIYMTNCYSTGFISGSEVMENGALSAWLGSSGAVITNCWSSATVSGTQNDDKYLARFDNATFTNCYSVNGTPLQATVINYEDLDSGALCYKLNGDQTYITWFQNLGQDEFPTFMPDHKIVYPAGQLECDGTFNAEEMSFSNDANAVVRKPHSFKDGFCTYCNGQDPEYPFLDVFANADHDTNEGYTTENSGDGSGLNFQNSVVEHWNTNWFHTYQPITGLQQGIYKLRVQGLQRVCQWNNESAEYGEGKLNEDFIPLYHSSQYFAEINGQKIANLFMDIAEQAQEERVNETENETNEALWVPNSLAACRKYFAKGLYWNTPLYFYVESENDTINVGVENNMYEYGNWTVWDTWRVEYVGTAEENASLIQKQQMANMQDLSMLEAQKSLMEEYEEAQQKIVSATQLQDILALANTLSNNPMLIRKSHLAYQSYDEAIKAIIEERGQRDDLNGEATELLDSYLDGNEEPSEELPNGSYLTIMEEKNLTPEELEAEILFVQNLYAIAIKTSIAEGSDLTNLIKNPGFSEDGSFKDWTETHTQLSDVGSNFSSNTGFTDIYPVAGTWNTSFNVYQDLEDELPNGIYEIEAPAFFRPGGNLMGDIEDYVTSSLYINDFYTPIMNIYEGALSDEEAINGVNCRKDPDDPSIPHAGENTSHREYESTWGWVPEQRGAVSFAFADGKRYSNKVYGIVTDNKIRLGIRNTGNPYYDSEMTMWGKFKLTYMGKSQDAMDAMIANFNKHIEKLEYAQEILQILYSKSHITTIKNLISQVEASSDADQKLALLQQINDEFNAIENTSRKIYQNLYDLSEWCMAEGGKYVGTDPDLSELFYGVQDEVMDVFYAGELTDEEAIEYYESILDRQDLGGGFYVQGDLLDAEGNNITYADITKLYPMTKNADGKYTARIKVQNRANQTNSNGRAGIYFTRLSSTLKCSEANRRFITPKNGTFSVVEGGNDFQCIGGEFDVILDTKNMTVEFKSIDYNWNDRAFVVGSVIDNAGEKHRWVNDEMCPLLHQGDGLYEGDVTFFMDSLHIADGEFLTFTIFTVRGATGPFDLNYTAKRSDWNEGRYGSSQNAIRVQDGEVITDLIRGADRQWWMVWDNEAETQSYHITFDMNAGSVSIKKNLDDEDGINSIDNDKLTIDNEGVYDLSGRRVSKPVKGLYIMNGKKVLVK